MEAPERARDSSETEPVGGPHGASCAVTQACHHLALRTQQQPPELREEHPVVSTPRDPQLQWILQLTKNRAAHLGAACQLARQNARRPQRLLSPAHEETAKRLPRRGEGCSPPNPTPLHRALNARPQPPAQPGSQSPRVPGVPATCLSFPGVQPCFWPQGTQQLDSGSMTGWGAGLLPPCPLCRMRWAPHPRPRVCVFWKVPAASAPLGSCSRLSLTAELSGASRASSLSAPGPVLSC